MVDEGKVDALTRAAEAISEHAEALHDVSTVALERQARRWRITSILLGIGMVALIVIALDNRDRGQSNSEILQDVDRLVEFVDQIEEEQENGPSDQTREVFTAIFQIRDALCAHDPTIICATP